MSVASRLRTKGSRLPDRSIADSLDALFFPSLCPVCGMTAALRTRPWCSGCDTHVRLWRRPICPICRRFRDASTKECEGGHPSGTPEIVVCLGAYDKALAAVVKALKYRGLRRLALPLGNLIARQFKGAIRFDTIVAIPTTARKIRERGFGHAEAIAESTSHALQIPFPQGALHWRRRVADQTRLTAVQRRTNLHEAMGAHAVESIVDRHVLVVDDVMTTGSTLAEAARALLGSGAKTISAAVVALNLSVPREME